MTADTSEARPVPVTFTSLSGAPLPAAIESIAVDPTGADAEACRIRFSMDYEVFERALADEAFHLMPEVLIGDAVSGFDPDRSVVVDARLRAAVARGFAARHGGLAHLADRIADDREVLRAESWLALTLVQEMDLPAELDDGAHASVGCETRWHQSSATAAPLETIAAVAARTLGELGYEVTRLDDHLCRTVVERGRRRWALLVHGDQAAHTCVCWSVYPTLAQPEQRGALASFLLEANYELSVGSFEMDPDDGEIRFRTSIDLGARALDPELFRRLVARNLEGIGRAIPLLDAFFA